MNAATLNRLVKSASLIGYAAIVAAGAGLINMHATPVSKLPVFELPRVVVTAQRQIIVELPRVVVTGQRIIHVDAEVAQRSASKPASRG